MLQIENSTDVTLLGKRALESFSFQERRHKYYNTPKQLQKLGPPPEYISVRGGWLCDEIGVRCVTLEPDASQFCCPLPALLSCIFQTSQETTSLCAQAWVRLV